jgi:hypothetical protein
MRSTFKLNTLYNIYSCVLTFKRLLFMWHSHAVRAECSYGRWHTALTVHFTSCCRRVIAFTLQPLYPRGEVPRVPLHSRLGGPHSRWCEEEKNRSASQNCTPSVQLPDPNPSHYTDSLSPQIYVLLGYYAGYSGKSLPPFETNYRFHLQGSKSVP